MAQTPKAKDVEEVMVAEDAAAPSTEGAITAHYRFIGAHAETIHKMDGTLPSVGPGDYIDLGPEDLENNANEAIVPFLIDATGQNPPAEF